MLSRIAESLFWIGRYVERADDTARLLDAFLRRVLEDPWTDEDAECRSLLAILGVPAPRDVVQNTAEIMRKVSFDEKTPTSIAGAVSAARENARGAREAISSEMWECLNVTWRALPERRRAAARLGPNTYLDYVRERRALKRGGAFHLTSASTEAQEVAQIEDLAPLSEALDALAKVDPPLAELVELKFFCGFDFTEIAAMRGVSERTVNRQWDKARLFLRHSLSDF